MYDRIWKWIHLGKCIDAMVNPSIAQILFRLIPEIQKIELHLQLQIERWPSGRRRTPGTRVYGNVSRVRIPSSLQKL